ncbi:MULTISPECIES: TAXI family TRAP transporter solute-binding subunit [unclassified Nocardioides]|uniref:TAXI family TRAP transporter solute-binding subunit n=1 Tax=unclassified Nocardioides TaxID=2615069 RepID=UPI0006FB0550|nr:MULTISPECIES: TAXI family TRAP transporter solute-binding subunit [unclassified Nocardioides]KQY62714.1 C4-dicarboxylate ABC transporter substrate-binding protein [Nocardioides sp. Root140]KQZ75884.1 C4-dicarboxylate ABC transporter substrate-binding protein [Nocardioides sp. Root151]KRF14957.1 C4-dicarboxylate ABC transporter substrate-binding protein [Nocardioides sp. Soil796]
MKKQKKLALLTAGIATAALTLAACGGQQAGDEAGSGADESSCDAGEGRLSIATGNSTGVYFVVGGGLAKLINDETDVQATSAETGASVQNIQQLVEGDYDVAFSLADTAADAVNGEGDFDSAEDVSTIGRIYSNYTQIVVRTDSGIDSVADFKGKRISTGSPQSGTEVIANKLIEAAGLKTSDVKAQRLDLTKTIDGMKDGSIDGLVWSGGIPTPALTDLVTSVGDDVKFLDATPLLPKLKKINQVYEAGTVPAATYELDKDVPSIVVPNLLMVRNDMRDNLACALTTLVFGETDKLVDVHPAAKEIALENGEKSDPVPVHPGSERAFADLAK